MLTKDQVFSIREFVFANYAESLWRVGDKMTELTPELLVTEEQKQTMSRFIVKHGRKVVADIEGAIYSLFNELAAPKLVEEEPTTPEYVN